MFIFEIFHLISVGHRQPKLQEVKLWWDRGTTTVTSGRGRPGAIHNSTLPPTICSDAPWISSPLQTWSEPSGIYAFCTEVYFTQWTDPFPQVEKLIEFNYFKQILRENKLLLLPLLCFPTSSHAPAGCHWNIYLRKAPLGTCVGDQILCVCACICVCTCEYACMCVCV
jgi:hypothetical protein